MGDDEVAGGLELVFRQGELAFLLAVEMPAVLIMRAGVLPHSDAGFLCVKRVIHAGFLHPRRYGFQLRGGGAGNQQGGNQVQNSALCRSAGCQSVAQREIIAVADTQRGNIEVPPFLAVIVHTGRGHGIAQ